MAALSDGRRKRTTTIPSCVHKEGQFVLNYKYLRGCVNSTLKVVVVYYKFHKSAPSYELFIHVNFN